MVRICVLLFLLAEVKPEGVLRQFGEHFFEFCKRSGYDHMLRTLGGNLFEFIENLDALHSYLSLSYKVGYPPCLSVFLPFCNVKVSVSVVP